MCKRAIERATLFANVQTHSGTLQLHKVETKALLAHVLNAWYNGIQRCTAISSAERLLGF